MSLIFRIYYQGKLITTPQIYRIDMEIFSKPDKEMVFSASTAKTCMNRILFLDEAYLYAEIPYELFEELRPYDIVITVKTESSNALAQKTIKSIVLNSPNENHNGKEFEAHIC
uniref:hypothetical protein n=1 Tax=Alistipes sp. TaxID=1872444 RepID=UPI0040569832